MKICRHRGTSPTVREGSCVYGRKKAEPSLMVGLVPRSSLLVHRKLILLGLGCTLHRSGSRREAHWSVLIYTPLEEDNMSRYDRQSTISNPGRTQIIRAGGLATLAGALFIFLAVCPGASAQVTGGTISGSVTDPS